MKSSPLINIVYIYFYTSIFFSTFSPIFALLKDNTMINAIFSTLPFGVCLFWSAIFLKEYRKAEPAKRLLTRFMLVCTMLYFSHAVYFNKSVQLFSIVESIYAFCTLAVYPLYYLYIRKLTDTKSLRIRDYRVLLPALLVSLTTALLYIAMGDERIAFVESYFYEHATSPAIYSGVAKAQCIRLILMKVVFTVQLIPVCYYGFKRLAAFNEQINNFYANTEGKTLAPIRSLLTVFLIFTFLSAIANYIGRDFFIQESWMVTIPSVIFSTMIFSVAYIGFKQNFNAIDFCRDEQTAGEKDELTLTATEEDDYDDERTCAKDTRNRENPDFLLLGETIGRIIKSQQLFRQKGLLITDVAKLAGSNRTYISTYLNQELNTSFSDFINNYRVEYAKSLLASKDPVYSIPEIFEMSGFTNEVSFYRIFKKHTGLTPKQWAKQQGNK
ncbi:helix-turn-helix protein [Bacteroides zoogleoformans]|nr:helix-turn-helix protein [Bacteroides zoogleoformans]